ncbi:MAG: MOSC domain-containing protein [Pseudomonadota bacterium]
MKVLAVSVSRKKGVKKTNIPSGRLLRNHGLEGDAHAGDWHRQVSLLAAESIDKMRGLGLEITPGDFAENVTTTGLDLTELEVGTRLRLGPTAVLELTQIGKECHQGCAIMKAVGKCVMPKEGVFFRVVTEGEIKPGDEIVVLGSCTSE